MFHIFELNVTECALHCIAYIVISNECVYELKLKKNVLQYMHKYTFLLDACHCHRRGGGGGGCCRDEIVSITGTY